MADEAKLCIPVPSVLKRWLCSVWSGIVMENWALSVDECWLPALSFSVHLINLLSIFLTCNEFTRIQKAVVDQMGSRPSNSDHDHDLFLVQIWLSEVLWSLGLTTELVVTGYYIKSTFCHKSQSNR